MNPPQKEKEMKYLKTKKQHVNSTRTCMIDHDRGLATSYGWFVIAKRTLAFGWVVARTGYSPTTTKHEVEVLRVLGYDTKTISAPRGLHNLWDSMNANSDRIAELREKEEKGRKGSWASEGRVQEIQFLEESNRVLSTILEEDAQKAS